MQTILTDVAAGIFEAEYHAPLPGGGHIRKRTLHGGLSDGVDVVEIDNGKLAFSVLPTRGMGLWKAECRTEGEPISLGWSSPVRQPVHPKFVDAARRGRIGWLDGFNELMCRCGLMFNGPPGDDNGSPITLHGRIANLPAHRVVVREADGVIEVEGEVDEASMFGGFLRMKTIIRTSANSPSLAIRDEITNLGGSACELQLLYHTNLGSPILQAGATIHFPFSELCPRDPRAADGIPDWDTYLGPTEGYAEQVYYASPIGDENGDSIALLASADNHTGVAVRFNVNELPCLSIWKCTQSESDGYVTGIEPGINFPNFKSFERKQGRVVSLASNDSYGCGMELTVYPTMPEVEGAAEEIATLQSSLEPRAHSKPQPKLAPQ